MRRLSRSTLARISIFKERLATIRLFYRSPKFVAIDLIFGLIALFSNPYRVCRKFLQNRGVENIHAYGETPFSTYARIVKQCGVRAGDSWIEMGSGRGKGCFWLAHFVKCKIIGIEWIAQFVAIARLMKFIFRVKNVDFRKQNMESFDLQAASYIYIYGHWPSLQIPRNAKVIVISEPLPDLPIVHSFWVRYPWGRTRAYVQTAKNSS